MTVPYFHNNRDLPADELIKLLIDRVRVERRRLGLSQAEFAQKCAIPLRSYKRFELGQSNSLTIFIQIVIVFERVSGIELLFPPKVADVKNRGVLAALERFRNAQGK